MSEGGKSDLVLGLFIAALAVGWFLAWWLT